MKDNDIIPKTPLPPMHKGETREEQIERFYAFYLERTMVDHQSDSDAIRETIDQALAAAPAPVQRMPLTAGAKTVLAVLVAFLVLTLGPLVVWTIGNVLLPMWDWGMAWAR